MRRCFTVQNDFLARYMCAVFVTMQGQRCLGKKWRTDDLSSRISLREFSQLWYAVFRIQAFIQHSHFPSYEFFFCPKIIDAIFVCYIQSSPSSMERAQHLTLSIAILIFHSSFFPFASSMASVSNWLQWDWCNQLQCNQYYGY
jgi:hypothetical protein